MPANASTRSNVCQGEAFLGELALGGTRVGTGINTQSILPKKTIAGIAQETAWSFASDNHFEAQGAIDACLETSGALKTVAVSLIKIANDIRWLGSGPRCGLGELRLPRPAGFLHHAGQS